MESNSVMTWVINPPWGKECDSHWIGNWVWVLELIWNWEERSPLTAGIIPLLSGCSPPSLITACTGLPTCTIPVIFTIHINCIHLTADKQKTDHFSFYYAGRKKHS
jgi:hypothetical protein